MNSTVFFKQAVSFLLLCLTACSNMTGSAQNNMRRRNAGVYSTNELKDATIANGIELQAKDVKVKTAFLRDYVSGKPLTENEVRLKQKFVMTIILDTGWTKVNGKTYVGASEKVTIDANNEVVISTEDLFKAEESISREPDMNKELHLGAYIDSAKPGVRNFTTTFRIWDKQGKGVVWGSYHFTVNP